MSLIRLIEKRAIYPNCFIISKIKKWRSVMKKAETLLLIKFTDQKLI